MGKRYGLIKLGWLCACVLLSAPSLAKDLDETRIRALVAKMLHEKDAKIADLAGRLKQLEQVAKEQQQTIDTLKAQPGQGNAATAPKFMVQGADHGSASEPTAKTQVIETPPPAPADSSVASNDDSSKFPSLFKSLKRKVERLVKSSEDNLTFHGFLDVTVSGTDLHSHTQFADPMQMQNFNMNAVELDVEYHFLDHFSGSAAFDWNNNNYAYVGAAILDYHSFDDATPPRGRIFKKDGFHIQAGTFDIPFGIDYQYNATPDRLTVTTPITTQRIQDGTFNPNNMWAGWNATGLRVYGTWNQMIDYSAYITNSAYGTPGRSAGGRLAVTLGHTPYRLHRQDSDHVIELGFSTLADWDKFEHQRNQVYGLDFTFNYEAVQLLTEAVWRQAYRPTDYSINNFSSPQTPGKNDMAWHATLVLNLDQWLKQRIYTFARYGQWRPNYQSICVNCDYQNPTPDNENSFRYAVGALNQLSLGFGYRFNDNVLFKFEYLDSLGTRTREPYFEKSRTQGQLVVSF